jgi:hypothetical protein
MQQTSNKTGFYIGVTCPGCGGDLELETDFFVLVCDHCDSALRIDMPDAPPAYIVRNKQSQSEVRFTIDRFLKQHDEPLTSSELQIKKLYYPYWKIDGMLLKLRNRIEERIVVYETGEHSQEELTTSTPKTDITVSPYMVTHMAGPELPGLAASIGMRAQHVTALPLSDENIEEGFDLMAVTRSRIDILEMARKSVDHFSHIGPAAFGSNRTELFRPVLSLVYFPYYVVEDYDSGPRRRYVVDGLSGRLVGPQTGEPCGNSEQEMSELSTHDLGDQDESSETTFGSLSVDFHRCRVCGSDLPGHQSYLYLCENCNELNVLDRSASEIRELSQVTGRFSQDDTYLPFWALQLPESLVRLLPTLFGGIDESDWLVVPAFKVSHFEGLFRLAKRMSTAFTKLDLESVETFSGQHLPVELSLSEAVTFSGVVLYRECLARGIKKRAAEVTVSPLGVRLFYAPFHHENYFYMDSVLGAIAVEKALLT